MFVTVSKTKSINTFVPPIFIVKITFLTNHSRHTERREKKPEYQMVVKEAEEIRQYGEEKNRERFA